MLFHRLHMRRIIPHRQYSAVNVRIERFDPAVHDLGKARDIANVHDGNSRVFNGAHRAAGGDDLDACGMKLPRELDDAGFVRNADQRPFDLHTYHAPLYRF